MSKPNTERTWFCQWFFLYLFVPLKLAKLAAIIRKMFETNSSFYVK